MFGKARDIFFVSHIMYLQENIPRYNFTDEKTDLGEVEKCDETLT